MGEWGGVNGMSSGVPEVLENLLCITDYWFRQSHISKTQSIQQWITEV